MSTKSSISYGDKYHLYYEAFKDDHVCLELDDVEYKATPATVMVAIPKKVFEEIIKDYLKGV